MNIATTIISTDGFDDGSKEKGGKELMKNSFRVEFGKTIGSILCMPCIYVGRSLNSNLIDICGHKYYIHEYGND